MRRSLRAVARRSGPVSASAALPFGVGGTRQDFDANVVAFNRSDAKGILLHSRVDALGTTVVLKGTLAGTDLSVDIPPLGGGVGAIAEFKTSSSKAGKYIQGRCKDKKINTRASSRFNDAPTAVATDQQKCKQKKKSPALVGAPSGFERKGRPPGRPFLWVRVRVGWVGCRQPIRRRARKPITVAASLRRAPRRNWSRRAAANGRAPPSSATQDHRHAAPQEVRRRLRDQGDPFCEARSNLLNDRRRDPSLPRPSDKLGLVITSGGDNVGIEGVAPFAPDCEKSARRS